MSALTYSSLNFGSLSILPFAPNQAQEVLEFFTDILPSYTNENEVRSQMRAIPRHTIQYEYDLQYIMQQGVFNVGYSRLRGNWAIPFWTEAQRISGTVGQVVYPLDTLVHDLRVGGMMMLYDLNRNWQVVEISTLTSTTVTGSASALQGQIFAIPLRVGYISGDIDLTPGGYHSTAKMTFTINDVLIGLGLTAPTQYRSMDLYVDPYLVGAGGAGSTKLTKQDDQVQYSLGNIDHTTPWISGQYFKQYASDGVGAAEIRAAKDFFYRRAGKMVPFISPSFESDLRKASIGAVTTTFKFVDDGFVAQLGATRRTLAFQMQDGTWALREISAPTIIGPNQAQVTLSSPLGVDASQIICVSYAGVNRLDTDRLELNHLTGGYFTSSYQVVELTS